MTEAAAPAPSLPYQRLLRSLPSYRWWKGLVALLLTIVFWVILTVIVVIIGVVIAVARGSIDFSSTDAAFQGLLGLFGRVDAADPLSISVALVSVATLLPSVLLAYRIVGLRPVAVLSSVQFRLRRRWLALCLLPALGITLLATAVQFFVFPLLFGGASAVAPSVPLGTFLVCAAIIVVITPIQAAAEEYAFRGLAAQMFGGWVRWVPIPIVLSGILFAAAHTQYIGWATIDVAVFALVAGFVTWRTGGLEASIALHSANNTIAFLTLASGIGGVTATDPKSSGDPYSLIVTVITMGLYALIVDRLARRRRLSTVLQPARE